MKRMWDKKQIVNIAEEHGGGKGKRGALVIEAPSSTILSTENRNNIEGGCFVNGEFLGFVNPMFYPSYKIGKVSRGLVIGQRGSSSCFSIYVIVADNTIRLVSPIDRIEVDTGGVVKIPYLSILNAISLNNNKLNDVADGEEDKDGVNVSQLNTQAQALSLLISQQIGQEAQARQEADRLINTYITQIAHDIEELESNKQNKNDNDLQTTSKNIVGAINEINANISGKNEIIVIQNTYTTRTATLTNLAKDEDNHPILQVNIGYKSSMTNHSTHHLDIIFNHTAHSIIAVYTNGIDFNTSYYYNAEWNSAINKFVIAVRKTDETSDTRDIYVEFSEDGNTATITFAKTYVNYIVGSNKL